MLLQSAHVSLCVRIVTQHSSWDDARATCEGQGGDLVVLDNAEKAQLLRNKVNQLTCEYGILTIYIKKHAKCSGSGKRSQLNYILHMA